MARNTSAVPRSQYTASGDPLRDALLVALDDGQPANRMAVMDRVCNELGLSTKARRKLIAAMLKLDADGYVLRIGVGKTQTLTLLPPVVAA